MSSNVIDEYEERKRLRRSRGRWRILAVLAVIAAVAIVLLQVSSPKGDHIARYNLNDVIFDDPARDALFKRIAEQDHAKALILRINSPGGSITGSEALYDSLRDIAKVKPVVATMAEVAASGGYIAALGADRIFARETSITGSVGVLFQVPNAHALMEKVGVSVIEFKSGPLKAEPSAFQPISEVVREAEQEMIAESFAWFLDLIRERRDLGDNSLAEVSRGGVFIGRRAKEIGLIDALGDQDDALAWLKEEHGIDSELAVIDYELQPEVPGFLSMFSGFLPVLPGASGLRSASQGRLMAIMR